MKWLSCIDSARTLHFLAQPIVSKGDLNSWSLIVILYTKTLFGVATNKWVCLPLDFIAKPVTEKLVCSNTFILFFLSLVKSPLRIESCVLKHVWKLEDYHY